MTKLINDLLTFTRLTESSDYELTDLNQLVDEVLSDLELMISDKHAKITVSDLPGAEIVTGQMRQVFQNIISNALKFSKKDVSPEISVTGQLIDSCSFDAKPSENGEYCKIVIRTMVSALTTSMLIRSLPYFSDCIREKPMMVRV
jgi:signal transduction histidine kinase